MDIIHVQTTCIYPHKKQWTFYLWQRLDLDVGFPHTTTHKTHRIPHKHSDFCIFNLNNWLKNLFIQYIILNNLAFNLKYNFLLLHEPAFPIKIIQKLYICWSIFPSTHRLSRPFEHATKVCEVKQYHEMQHPSYPWVAKIVPIITWIWPLKGKCSRRFTLVQKCLYSTASETYCSLSAFNSNHLRASVSYDALSRLESIIT